MYPWYIYLDGFGKFLVTFAQKYIFTLVKKLGRKKEKKKKKNFLAMSSKYNLTIWIDSLWNSLPNIVHFHVNYSTLLVFKFKTETSFHKKLQNCKGGTILALGYFCSLFEGQCFQTSLVPLLQVLR